MGGVRVAERSGCRDDGTAQHPVGCGQLRCKRTQCQPVRNWDEYRLEAPVDKAKGDPVEEREHDHGSKKREPAIDQLLPEARVEAEPDGPARQRQLVLPVVRRALNECQREHPGEDEPDLDGTCETEGLVEVTQLEEDVVSPEVVE